MKIAHLSDLHYCEKHLELVDAAVGAAIEEAVRLGVDLFVFSGDSYDAAIQLHHPAVVRLLRRVAWCANRAPVVILQGTFSHDRPGSLEAFKHMRGRFPVHVADKAERIVLSRIRGEPGSLDELMHFDINPEALLPRDLLAICALPSVNRADIQATEAGTSTSSYLDRQFAAWAPANAAARAAGVPTILVSHGTVNGCITESKQAMVSPDHEFGAAALFSAGTDAVLLGHIHAYQSWTFHSDGHVYGAYEEEGTYRPRIAYPGSVARLINGHEGAVGMIRWDVRPGGAEHTLFETPGPKLIDIEFDGPPDMAVLAQRLRECRGAKVRVRYSVDEEHRASVDREGIEQMLAGAGLAGHKLEGHVNPVQRTRAAGISREESTVKRLEHWCQLTETKPEPLVQRLHILESTI